MVVSAGHASATYLRRFVSAFGAGSVAITSNPRARYCAAQLAPMTPVPTTAIRRMGLFKDMGCCSCVSGRSVTVIQLLLPGRACRGTCGNAGQVAEQTRSEQ